MEEQDFREKKKLEELVERIERNVDSVIVEGFSDKLVIQELGFEGKIFLSAERATDDLIEDVSRASERVAVLTDFDEHGKQQNREIARELEKEVDVIRSLREEFGSQLTSTGRHAIEDIKPLFHSRQEKFVDAALDTIFFRG